MMNVIKVIMNFQGLDANAVIALVQVQTIQLIVSQSLVDVYVNQALLEINATNVN